MPPAFFSCCSMNLPMPFCMKMTRPSITARATIPNAPLFTMALPPPLKASKLLVMPPEMMEFQGSSFFRTATIVQSQIENKQPHTAKDPTQTQKDKA